ncbi:proline racemase family protein [Candidatus Eisenbacteria bacterium]|uniref:Proline racemase family protein n=1 Tax=Eiseniibacteriota bacterium TaxID=2212470 RepID=A0ABV6YML2_UNCEI
MAKINLHSRWSPPSEWDRIRVIDAHTEGEPLRVILNGFPQPHGTTILARRRYARQWQNHLRQALMWEPRGHADMYGCLITPAATAEADFGVLFLHNEGFSTMCGHGIIAVTTVVLETGMLAMHTPETTVRIDTPAGLVVAQATVEGRRVTDVRFRNVPSFVLSLDRKTDVPGLGAVAYDIAFGGAFYAFVQAEAFGLKLRPEATRDLIDVGMKIKSAVSESQPITHPFDQDLGFLYGTIFIGPPVLEGSHSRNVCVFAEGEVDRSPTGTGVSARLALHHKRGEIKPGEQIVIESIIGTTFRGSVAETTTCGPYEAVVPEVCGTAHITGTGEMLLDPGDPLRHGFLLR